VDLDWIERKARPCQERARKRGGGPEGERWRGRDWNRKKKEKKLLCVAINDENSILNKENGLDRGIFYHIFCFTQLHMCLDRKMA